MINKIEPAASLKHLVKCFIILQNSVNQSVPETFKIIADGCPGLIFQQRTDAFTNCSGTTFPSLYLHGLTTSHAENIATGNYSNLIVHFYPHALKAVFGLHASELTNSFAALNDIVANNLTDRLMEADSIDQKIALLSAFLLKLSIKNADASQAKMAYIISKIKTAGPDFSLSNLYSELSLSGRSLERMVKTHIGVSPKIFFRISRFQNALDILRRKKSNSLCQLAYESNYFDQSHYIRDFRQFTGSAPREFILKADEQIANYPNWRV